MGRVSNLTMHDKLIPTHATICYNSTLSILHKVKCVTEPSLRAKLHTSDIFFPISPKHYIQKYTATRPVESLGSFLTDCLHSRMKSN